jgi:hypothetical protein
MEVRVPVMIQDQFTAKQEEMEATELVSIEGEDVFLDGPVSRRVAVVDFDEKSGALLPGAHFVAPGAPDKPATYEVKDPRNLQARDFNQVSVFGTVLSTVSMFEEPDTLGRKVVWAFGAPQLLVVPRAGEMPNAFYERDSRSLQFFSLSSDRAPAGVIHSSLSHDIISHETGHAVLDGIAPTLYDTITPQSLALHEAIGDLTALVMSARSRKLREAMLRRAGGSIEGITAMTALAEEFGHGCDPQGRKGCLRLLKNDRTLDPDDKSVDQYGRPNLVSRTEPHELSEVLTGALYAVMVKIHEERKHKIMIDEGKSEFSASGKALYIAAEQFKRMIFRALDYLPPGEISFADYARAIIASDQASHPEDEKERDWIRDEFVKRRMVTDRAALDVEPPHDHPAMEGLDPQALVESDWAAYEFARKWPALLQLTEGMPVKILPRLDVKKTYFHRGHEQTPVRECIFKVQWDQLEPNGLGRRFDEQRRYTVGTTLVMEWPEGMNPRVRAVLTSDRSREPEVNKQEGEDRTQMLRRLAEQDLLRIGEAAIGPDKRPLRSVVAAASVNGTMRVRGAARMLHIVREG